MLLMQHLCDYIFFRKKQRELIREVQDVTHMRELESVFEVSFASYVIILF